MKRNPTEGENIFANDTSDKGLIFKIYGKLIMLNTKERESDLRMGKGLE